MLQLTHWGRATHICIGKLTSIASDNGLSPGRRQAIIWTNAGILLIRPLGTNFSEILIEIQIFSLKKIHLKMLSAKWWPFCLGLNVLTSVTIVVIIYGTFSPISLNPIRDEPCVFPTDDAPCWVRYWSAIARHHVIDRSQDDSVAMASCAISWRQILRYFWRPWLISLPPHLMLCISQSTLIAINEPFVVHLDCWEKNSGSNQTTVRVFEGNHCKSP